MFSPSLFSIPHPIPHLEHGNQWEMVVLVPVAYALQLALLRGFM